MIFSVVVKKSYYKLALIYHPDRVDSVEDKELAKEKFNLIHNAYSILSDATKKNLYDNGSKVLFSKATNSAMWENYLKPITNIEISTAMANYRGSIVERNDVMREIVLGKGSLTHLLNNIPFMRIEDEMRMIELVKDLIEKGMIPKLKIKRIK